MTNVGRSYIGDVSEQIRGVTYEKTEAQPTFSLGLVPLLRANNIGEHGLLLDDLVFVPASRVSEKQRLQTWDVLIAASSGSLSVVGKAAQVTANVEGTFGAFCKVLRPSANVDPNYFHHFFRTLDYRRKISFLAAGANINNLRNSDLNDLEIRLPPMKEQRRIAAILDQAEALRTKRRQARHLGARYFRGERLRTLDMG